MTSTATRTRLPWQNRWDQPTIEQLLKPLIAQRRRLLELIMKEADQYPQVDQQIVWYGPGWNWTIQYAFKDKHDGLESDILCYLVANVETPLVCVPLSDAEIAKLPMRRLNKLIRNSIRIAKCAVTIHWAKWTPTNQTEIAHINDLIKRKYKLATGKTPRKSGNGKK